MLLLDGQALQRSLPYNEKKPQTSANKETTAASTANTLVYSPITKAATDATKTRVSLHPSTFTASTWPAFKSTSAETNLPNLDISNGHCYAGPNMPMDNRFIPCGNAEAQVQTCCWQGDFCLADRACFGIHDGGFNTYLAGCTDVNWNTSDPVIVRACPIKPEPYENDPWIGLAYCGDSSGNNATDSAWIACPQKSSPTTMVSAGPCVCLPVTEQRIVAFTDGPTLSSYASLPMTLGGSISWISPFVPSYVSTAAAVLTASQGVSNAPAQSPVSTWETSFAPSQSTASDHSQGLKVGLGVAGALLVLIISTAMITFFTQKRKRKKAVNSAHCDNTPDGKHDGPGVNPSGLSPVSKPVPLPPPVTHSRTVSELDIRPARLWSVRSELDGGIVDATFKEGPAIAPATYARPVTQISIGTLLSSPINSPQVPGNSYDSLTVSSIRGQLTGHTTGQPSSLSGGSDVHIYLSSQQGADQFKAPAELEG
ncbi:MAG: hypothetical protein SEPTF4163_006451 [Sporothrix epigloea]